VRRTEWPWPRADGLAGVDGLAGGYATDEVALAPEPESSSKKSGRRCRIGAAVFVAGVRPPTRGGAKAEEPRS
jgi:hypothetical protein